MTMVAKKNMKLRDWKEGAGGKLDAQLPAYLAGYSDFIKHRNVIQAQQWLATGGAWPKQAEKQHKGRTDPKKKEKKAKEVKVGAESWLKNTPWADASWGWMPNADTEE